MLLSLSRLQHHSFFLLSMVILLPKVILFSSHGRLFQFCLSFVPLVVNFSPIVLYHSGSEPLLDTFSSILIKLHFSSIFRSVSISWSINISCLFLRELMDFLYILSSESPL